MQKNRLWTLWPLLNLLFSLACACASNLKLYWKHSQSIVTNLCLFMALLWDVYSWDQAGKWNCMGLVMHKVHQQFTVSCSLQKLSKNIGFFFSSSYPVWLCHTLCCLLPSGPCLCSSEQHHRGPSWCKKICYWAEEARHSESKRYRWVTKEHCSEDKTKNIIKKEENL